MTLEQFAIEGLVLQRLSDDAVRALCARANISTRRVLSSELVAVGLHEFTDGRRIFFGRSDWKTHCPLRFETAEDFARYQRRAKRHSGGGSSRSRGRRKKSKRPYVPQVFGFAWCAFDVRFLNDFGALILAQVWVPQNQPASGALSAFTF